MKLRATAAATAVRVVNLASKWTGRGSGTVAGGRVGLAVDPTLLEHLSAGRRSVLVSGTNGKTTTTALLAAALRTSGDVATNATGSNMLPGHVAALVERPRAPLACLEVDEAWLPAAAAMLQPVVIVLLNLSRDQLDRSSEVRMLAQRWRTAVGDRALVVANCDDPMVTWAAQPATQVVWVAAGLGWREDAGACPSCRGAIIFDAAGWRCDTCDLRRPQPAWWLEGGEIVGPDCRMPLELSLPGAFNRANAACALAAAAQFGVEPRAAAVAISAVGGVAGRFEEVVIAGTPARLMLAKNPAGWSALLEVVADETGPVVVAINSRTADGADPSWLFDVDFSQLVGRRVVATGDRWRDLAVRLRYAGVPHTTEPDPAAAVVAAGAAAGIVEVIGNYTAFRDLREVRR